MRDPKVGLRSWKWTAVAPTEEGVVRAMARCLREFRGGRCVEVTNPTSQWDERRSTYSKLSARRAAGGCRAEHGPQTAWNTGPETKGRRGDPSGAYQVPVEARTLIGVITNTSRGVRCA